MYKVFINDTPFFIHTKGTPKDQEIRKIKGISLDETRPKKLFDLTMDSGFDAVRYDAGENIDIFWNEWRKQFIEIEAAGGLVLNAESAFLGIYRLNHWDLPKGKSEQGETAAQTALREVEEECGITGLTIGYSLPDTFHIYPYKNRFALKRTFWFEMHWDGAGELKPEAEEGIEAVRWFTPAEKSEFMGQTWASIRDVIEAYFKH